MAPECLGRRKRKEVIKISIGLYDADMATYTLVPFNLELMKLSAYYKRRKEIVILCPQYTPERYSKFFYRKDYDDGDFPISLTTTPNLEYGGLAFSDGRYVPMDLSIERMRPDTSIYERMESLIRGENSKARDKIYQNMVEAEHCRLSLDGKTVWSDYESQFKCLMVARNLMIHDPNLGQISGALDAIKSCLARARTDGWATRLGFKYPVEVDTDQALLDWTSFNSNSTFYGIRYNGVISNPAFMKFMDMNYERSKYSTFEYHVTKPSLSETELTQNLLPQILHQVIISRNQYVFFLLKYDKEFFTEPMWGEVLRLFNYYQHSFSSEPKAKYLMKIRDDTMYDFVCATLSNTQKLKSRYKDEALSRQEIRNIFAFVREKNYPLFKEFYECSARTLGGTL